MAVEGVEFVEVGGDDDEFAVIGVGDGVGDGVGHCGFGHDFEGGGVDFHGFAGAGADQNAVGGHKYR